ncbi:MAG: response regulator [Deltaproteobacteria bacterium]|nr:response regulator [Deltaproteobacteria bacterium]
MAKILVVDDDASFRHMLCLSLGKDGHSVVEASDGNMAVKLVGNESVDLVITDIIMPDKEGIELILELKKTNPEIKIIAISGGGVTAGQEVCQNRRFKSIPQGVERAPLDYRSYFLRQLFVEDLFV